MLVATDAKGVMQQGGGHLRSLKEDFRNLLEECHVHAFSTIRCVVAKIDPRVRFSRMSLFLIGRLLPLD